MGSPGGPLPPLGSAFAALAGALVAPGAALLGDVGVVAAAVLLAVAPDAAVVAGTLELGGFVALATTFAVPRPLRGLPLLPLSARMADWSASV